MKYSRKRGQGHKHRRPLEQVIFHPVTLGAAVALGVVLMLVPALWLAAVQRADAEGRERTLARANALAAQAARENAPQTAPVKQEPQPKAAATSEKKEKAPKNDTRMVAFYANWGNEGYRSLRRNAPHIDTLMPMWFHLGSNGKLTEDDPAENRRVMRMLKERNPDMKVMPIVNNYDKSSESWNPEQISRKLRSAKQRKAIAKRIVKTLDSKGYDGVNIDFEGFTEADRGVLVLFMRDLYPIAHKAGLEVSMDVIVGSRTYNHKQLARSVDYMIPMMYDEHWKTSSAGAIASVPWFDRTLEKFLDQVPAEKVIVGLGTYAYDWGKSGVRAKSLSFDEATKRARAKGKVIRLNRAKLNSTYSYRSSNGTKRTVWMLDAASAFNQVQVAKKHKTAGYAIWRLGAEDPALWKVLPRRDSLDERVAERLENDKRSVKFDSERGLITRQFVRP